MKAIVTSLACLTLFFGGSTAQSGCDVCVEGTTVVFEYFYTDGEIARQVALLFLWHAALSKLLKRVLLNQALL